MFCLLAQPSAISIDMSNQDSPNRHESRRWSSSDAGMEKKKSTYDYRPGALIPV
jgi:hypothetical protein